MSETKHTPGPWEVFYRHKYNKWHVGVDTNNPEADARLIAKAPEILAALEMMVTFNCRRCKMLNGTVSCGTCFILEHKQLIAEAKGEKQ